MRNELYDTLKHRIVHLDYKPGQALQEMELAEEFGVSRTPIREAFIRLEAEGLVGVERGRGIHVSEVSFRNLKDSFEVRSHLAGLVGRLVPERATKQEIAALRSLLKQVEEETNPARLRELDMAFHHLVNRATHNECLCDVLERMRNQVTRIWDANVPEGDDHYFAGIGAEFRAFLKGAERRDGSECTEVLRAHLARFIDEIISFAHPAD